MNEHDTATTAAAKATPLLVYFGAKLAGMTLADWTQVVAFAYGVLMLFNQAVLIIERHKSKKKGKK
jgi:hypothetical protein